MSINVNDKNLGHATAYAYYKAGGGTMTEAEFTEFMADFGTASQTAVEAAQAALASETAARNASTTATNKATEATTAATTATTKAGEASTSASTATSAKDTAVSASQTATTKATEATTAAATATSAATTATTAKDDAVSAKTAAQTAQTGAETAAASVQSSAAQIATNAEDISQLKSELTDIRVGADGVTYGSAGVAVREQITYLEDNLQNNLRYFPHEMKEDICKYLDYPSDDITTYLGKAYDINGVLSDASGRFSVTFPVMPNDELHFSYALFGYNSLFPLLFCKGNEVIEAVTNSGLVNASNSHYYCKVPKYVDNIKTTGTESTIANAVIQILSYNSIATKQYADNEITNSPLQYLTEIVPAATSTGIYNAGVGFNGNSSANDPLVVTIPAVYYRNRGITGTGYTYVAASGSPYSLGNNQLLVFDTDTKQLNIISASTIIDKKYITLLWKHETTIKGEWAHYYYEWKNKNTISYIYPSRVMSRQGEGYGYPDNSLEAILSALNDGYKKIRIAVAATSDNVFYCTHAYELEHNADNNVLTQNGTAYTENVNINNVTSTFIDTLLYKGYAIPKLEDVLDAICGYDVEVTLELKNTFDATTAQLLINEVLYYSIPIILSGDYWQLGHFTALNTKLDLAWIFQFSDSELNTYLPNLVGKFNTLRFDCYYANTITKQDVISKIHPDYKLKLGGSTVTVSQAKAYLAYVDVVEYQGKISDLVLA